jgi:hypothetical protein
MKVLTPRYDEAVARLLRHPRRAMFIRWAASHQFRGVPIRNIAKRQSAGKAYSNRFDQGDVENGIALVVDAMRAADPQRKLLPNLLRSPRQFWPALLLWQAGFTTNDILTLPRTDISNRVRRVGWRCVTAIRALANGNNRRAA